jgi:hypothetical protein
MAENDYFSKYLKYKKKYIELKNLLLGGVPKSPTGNGNDSPKPTILKSVIKEKTPLNSIQTSVLKAQRDRNTMLYGVMTKIFSDFNPTSDIFIKKKNEIQKNLKDLFERNTVEITPDILKKTNDEIEEQLKKVSRIKKILELKDGPECSEILSKLVFFNGLSNDLLNEFLTNFVTINSDPFDLELVQLEKVIKYLEYFKENYSELSGIILIIEKTQNFTIAPTDAVLSDPIEDTPSIVSATPQATTPSSRSTPKTGLFVNIKLNEKKFLGMLKTLFMEYICMINTKTEISGLQQIYYNFNRDGVQIFHLAFHGWEDNPQQRKLTNRGKIHVAFDINKEKYTFNIFIDTDGNIRFTQYDKKQWQINEIKKESYYQLIIKLTLMKLSIFFNLPEVKAEIFPFLL